MNNLPRFSRRAALAAMLALACGSQAAAAAEVFPKRPVRLIVPYAAGGGPDILARKLGEGLSRQLGQPVVVENKVGAAGFLAAEYVAQQPADGYTLLLGASTHVTQKLLQPSVRFDPATFTHIMRLGSSSAVLLVGASSPWRSAADLIAAARREPHKFNYASGGIGSAAHLAGAAFSAAAGIDTLHIPYKGSVEIVPSLIKGDTHFGFPVASTALPQIASGKARALAVASARRDPALPDVPTLNEALGRSDLALESWSGIWAPPKLPAAVVARLHQALLQTLADPGLRDFYARAGSPVDPTPSPVAFDRFIAEEIARYRAIIERNHITMQ